MNAPVRKTDTMNTPPVPSTNSKTIGYLLWIVGFTGAHRFYFGKPVTGTLWLFTLGLFGIGWLVDLFLIPSMDRAANRKFATGHLDYLGGLGCCPPSPARPASIASIRARS